MGAAEKIHWTPLRMTAEEYLEWEKTSPEKWEYLDGEVVPVHGYIYEKDEIVGMAGALPRHNLLSANLIIQVGIALQGKPCRVYSAVLKVKAGKNYVFPDATIICGKLELKEGSRDILTNPKVVFEVLSDSTEFKDRTLKLRDYFKLKSLQEYVLINQNQALVEQYIR